MLLIRHESTAAGRPILSAFCADKVGYHHAFNSCRINEQSEAPLWLRCGLSSKAAAAQATLEHIEAL
jgi:hypothetical protein